MGALQKRVAWQAVAAGATALAGIAVRKGLDRAWLLATDEEPPHDPTSADVAWRDAIIWTVATGVVIGLARLLARRGAAAGWEAMTGEDPPG
jgi:hypothetical protein